MTESYWLTRWRTGNISFHKDEVNPLLRELGAKAYAPPPGRVLVPLCGKSIDMAYLADRGYAVTGVDLAEEAALAFFADRDLAPSRAARGPFTRLEAGPFTFWIGDFFALSPGEAGLFDAAYDRAALVAVPPETRGRYAARLLSLLRPGGAALVVSFDYDEGATEGPPFRLDGAELAALFAQGASVTELAERDALDANPSLRARGLTRLREGAYRVEKPGAAR